MLNNDSTDDSQAVSDNPDDDDNDQGSKPPSIVVEEEDVFSSDMAEAEPADIDEELAKVGLKNDDDGVKPLTSEENVD